ncbi:MAG: Unknown protein [uncultured Thiotrichaceae bacterium]|uniref:Uncharacterized protein n=1 Tax=uncultured Thiotrichaceae bacterium TaxID=298394 RepID=A0A6S6SAP1_9GAMM|nr:MAG: Unknown protein [uncultured Thiotrichaceae bacterium]
MKKQWFFWGLILLLLILAAGYFINNSKDDSGTVRQVKDMPWQVDVVSDNVTSVLSLEIGQSDLASVVATLRKVPKMAAFENAKGERIIEAFFDKVKLGVFFAAIAVEVDIEGVDISKYARFDSSGKPMPSGQRKYMLSKTGLLDAYKLRVWKLAYLAKTNYSEAQLLKFFGQPSERKVVTKELEYWIYPEKSMVVVFDKEGKEVFYYSASKEFERLKASIKVDNE